MIEKRKAKNSVNAFATSHENEPAATLAGTGIGADNDAKAGGIDELQPAQVEDDQSQSVI
ncbi:MAG: hypothetical protein WD276_10010 [Actinomycetota bacterium]